jgi:hypothetical protein
MDQTSFHQKHLHQPDLSGFYRVARGLSPGVTDHYHFVMSRAPARSNLSSVMVEIASQSLAMTTLQ